MVNLYDKVSVHFVMLRSRVKLLCSMADDDHNISVF